MKKLPDTWNTLNVSEWFRLRGSYPRDLRIKKTSRSNNLYAHFLPDAEDDPRPEQGRSKSGKRITISESMGTSDPYEGAKRAGFTAFLSGLRNRLSNKNVDVITILPGYINTKMTKNIALPKILTASTNQVANEIFNSYVKKKDVVYVLPIWKIIMTIIKLIPEFIFKRTNL